MLGQDSPEFLLQTDSRNGDILDEAILADHWDSGKGSLHKDVQYENGFVISAMVLTVDIEDSQPLQLPQELGVVHPTFLSSLGQKLPNPINRLPTQKSYPFVETTSAPAAPLLKWVSLDQERSLKVAETEKPKSILQKILSKSFNISSKKKPSSSLSSQERAVALKKATINRSRLSATKPQIQGDSSFPSSPGLPSPSSQKGETFPLVSTVARYPPKHRRSVSLVSPTLEEARDPAIGTRDIRRLPRLPQESTYHVSSLRASATFSGSYNHSSSNGSLEQHSRREFECMSIRENPGPVDPDEFCLGNHSQESSIHSAGYAPSFVDNSFSDEEEEEIPIAHPVPESYFPRGKRRTHSFADMSELSRGVECGKSAGALPKRREAEREISTGEALPMVKGHFKMASRRPGRIQLPRSENQCSTPGWSRSTSMISPASSPIFHESMSSPKSVLKTDGGGNVMKVKSRKVVTFSMVDRVQTY